MNSRRGFTFLEVVIAVAVLSVALTSLLFAIFHFSRTNATLREDLAAMRAAEAAIEKMRAAPFDRIFALYNGNPADDPPPGPGSAPGALFDVEDLLPQAPGGQCGRILFPTVPGDLLGEQLREDLELPEWGLPRDLNGDGVIGSASVANSYKILPIAARIEWRGVRGPSAWTYRTILLKGR